MGIFDKLREKRSLDRDIWNGPTFQLNDGGWMQHGVGYVSYAEAPLKSRKYRELVNDKCVSFGWLKRAGLDRHGVRWWKDGDRGNRKTRKPPYWGRQTAEKFTRDVRAGQLSAEDQRIEGMINFDRLHRDGVHWTSSLVHPGAKHNYGNDAGVLHPYSTQSHRAGDIQGPWGYNRQSRHPQQELHPPWNRDAGGRAHLDYRGGGGQDHRGGMDPRGGAGQGSRGSQPGGPVSASRKPSQPQGPAREEMADVGDEEIEEGSEEEFDNSENLANEAQAQAQEATSSQRPQRPPAESQFMGRTPQGGPTRAQTQGGRPAEPARPSSSARRPPGPNASARGPPAPQARPSASTWATSNRATVADPPADPNIFDRYDHMFERDQHGRKLGLNGLPLGTLGAEAARKREQPASRPSARPAASGVAGGTSEDDMATVADPPADPNRFKQYEHMFQHDAKGNRLGLNGLPIGTLGAEGVWNRNQRK